MKTYEVFCGSFTCRSRREGRLFKVVDTEGMTAGERALLVKPDGGLIDGVDGVLTDEVDVWRCADCMSGAAS